MARLMDAPFRANFRLEASDKFHRSQRFRRLTGIDTESAASFSRRAKAAEQIDDQTDQENQAKAAAADGRAADIKTAATEKEEKDDDEEQ